jgi:hypothetical protein
MNRSEARWRDRAVAADDRGARGLGVDVNGRM